MVVDLIWVVVGMVGVLVIVMVCLIFGEDDVDWLLVDVIFVLKCSKVVVIVDLFEGE